MTKQIFTDLNFNGGARPTGLPTPVGGTDAANKDYVDNAIEGLAWKDDVRVATQSNISLTSPGASIDGITMAVGDRVLVKSQTTASENGIYVWNGATTAMGRAGDASTSADLNNAIVSVDLGTSASTQWRCTTVDAVIGTDAIAWQAFNTGAPAATETTAGIAKVATQVLTDGGTDDTTIVTPKKLAAWAGRMHKVGADIGDGSATQYDVTHNLGTRDVEVTMYRNSSPYDEVIADIGHLDTNTVRLTFASAPTANQFRCIVIG